MIPDDEGRLISDIRIEQIKESAKSSKLIVSIEEHSIYGGLGECCSSIISQSNMQIKYKILGIPDEYMMNGTQEDVLDHYGMSPEKIANTSLSLIT